MHVRGKVLGVIVMILAALLFLYSLSHTSTLQEQRQEVLQSLPLDTECNYEDLSLCPQAEEQMVLPDLAGTGVFILALLLGLYLFHSDRTQRRILDELGTKREQLSAQERKALIFGILTKSERSIVEAVLAQPGITQATLRIRTGLSKAKLSQVLKELETRNLVVRKPEGKTNTVHLKKEL